MLDSKNIRQLYFVGAPRTGSTLLGQILNYHPQCLISNESRYLQKILRNGHNPQQAFNEMVQEAIHQFELSLEHTPRFNQKIDTYQPKWKSFNSFKNDPEFNKSEIRVIGDKKAGGNVQVYREDPAIFQKFIDQVGPYFLFITRNPVNTAKSYLKSHGAGTFDQAMAKILDDTRAAIEIQNITDKYKIVYYEDLQKTGNEVLTNICRFIELNESTTWCDKVLSVVDKDDEIDDEDKPLYDIMNNFLLKDENQKIRHLFERFLIL